MKRFISALTLCISLLILLSVYLFPPVRAKENPILTLLNLPAPPPPNPDVHGLGGLRDEKFYDKTNSPKDNAPIDEILDYWHRKNGEYQESRHNIEPSDVVSERILKEIADNPKLLGSFLNVLTSNSRAADLVKTIYDRGPADGGVEKAERKTVKDWLLYNSPHFSDELARIASDARDSAEYVTGQRELLALSRVDFDRARPIVDRLNNDTSLKTSRVLAKWALYRHALDTSAIGDIDEYRDQLKKIVEDKSAIPGMRDLALDALANEKSWPGRDDWYFSLFTDETLLDLRVGGQTFSGLTTMMMMSTDDKYVDKMIEFTKSSNAAVRSAAVRNLATRLDSGNPEIIKALLPWLEDPKWAVDTNDARATLIRKLGDLEVPESVPGLISVLDEKPPFPIHRATGLNSPSTLQYYDPANRPAQSMANAANAMANAANAVANIAAKYADGNTAYNFAVYPNRSSAVLALAKQKDARAVPSLRRILPEGERYEAGNIVRALLICGGFTVGEQMDALEIAAKGVKNESEIVPTSAMANRNAAWGDPVGPIAVYGNANGYSRQRATSPHEVKSLLAEQLAQSTEISDELAQAIVAHIEIIDAKDPALAHAFRQLILKWQNAAINTLLLSDVKRGIADADTMVRLLGQRKSLREKQSTDVFDVLKGKGAAIGIAACLLEDVPNYTAILAGTDPDEKTALLACARLIRAPLPVAKVAENLKSPSEMLKIGAERYLESEDSAEARGIVLALHPNEARIMGAKSAFFSTADHDVTNPYLFTIFQSIGNDMLYYGWFGSSNDDEITATEKRLQTEVKKDNNLNGVYAYEGNYVRIYKDRVIYSWDEDDARYRERPLNKPEFEELKSFLAANRADDLPPFLSCGGAYCEAKELIMLGRGGGRRVYMNGGTEMYYKGRSYDFFGGLDKYFAGLKQSPATLKYTLSREIPGLEIILASDELHAETVWKEGSDLRIAASAVAIRKKIENEIDDLDTTDRGDYDQNEAKKAEMREKRRYEGFSWYKLGENGFESGAVQPPQVEFIRANDGVGIESGDEQWKARTADMEIRASAEGLFKIVHGKVTKLRPGSYQNPVITPNGRWALVSKTDDTLGLQIFRVDLVTNKEYPIKFEGYGERYPSAFVPMLNKILVARKGYDEYSDGEANDRVPVDADAVGMALVDAATGAVQPVTGEFRPLDQQTFRPLQKAAKPNEYWAAMPGIETNETLVGIFDAGRFTFRQVLRVPKIKFNSMSMWVDEPGGKIYFVYRGHLLALPLNK